MASFPNTRDRSRFSNPPPGPLLITKVSRCTTPFPFPSRLITPTTFLCHGLINQKYHLTAYRRSTACNTLLLSNHLPPSLHPLSRTFYLDQRGTNPSYPFFLRFAKGSKLLAGMALDRDVVGSEKVDLDNGYAGAARI